MAIATLSPRQSRFVVLSVMLGLFLGAMEATVVATALPTIVAKLSGLSLYAWPMAIYILASAVTGPLFGKISDIHGRRTLFLTSLGVFLAGSLLSGISQNMIQLISFRAIQGLGAGGVMPLSIIIAGDMFPFEKRAKIQPLFSMVWGIASLVGPPLGMWLASYSWRLVFLVNIPFGILSGILVFMFLRETPDREVRRGIDYLGAALLTLGLLAFEFALPQEALTRFPAWRLALFAASLALLAVFLSHERSVDEPILPLSLMRFPMFSSASLCQFFTGMALFGSLSYIPLYIEAVLGKGIRGTGMILTLLLFTWVLFSFLSSRLMLKIGYRFLVITGTFLVTLGFAVMSAFAGSGDGPLKLAVMLMGAGMGWIMAPLIVAVQSSVPKKHLGIATSSQVLFRTAGATLGVSILGSVLAERMQASLHAALRAVNDPAIRSHITAIFKDPNQVMDPVLRARVSPEILSAVKSTMAHSLQGVFLAACAFALVSLFAGFLVPGGKAEKHFHRES